MRDGALTFRKVKCTESFFYEAGMLLEIVVSSTYFHVRVSILRSLIMSKKIQWPCLVP